MLKIVDYYPNTKIPFPLKELEKFGFVFLQNYYVVLNSKYRTVMYIDKERCVISSLNFSTLLSDLELYTNILFDLIKAVLVEKV